MLLTLSDLPYNTNSKYLIKAITVVSEYNQVIAIYNGEIIKEEYEYICRGQAFQKLTTNITDSCPKVLEGDLTIKFMANNNPINIQELTVDIEMVEN